MEKKEGELRQQLLDLFLDHILRNKAHNLIGNLAALEEQQRRNTANPEARGRSAVLIHVDLGHLQLAGLGSGNAIDDRPNGLAGTAPDSPKIHQDRLLTLKHLLIKRCIANFQNTQTSHTPPCGDAFPSVYLLNASNRASIRCGMARESRKRIRRSRPPMGSAPRSVFL